MDIQDTISRRVQRLKTLRRYAQARQAARHLQLLEPRCPGCDGSGIVVHRVGDDEYWQVCRHG